VKRNLLFLSSSAVLLVATQATAEGESESAVRLMRANAMHACDRAMRGEVFDSYEDYVKNRDEAVKLDPAVTHSTASAFGGKTIAEQFPECERLFAAFEKTWGGPPVDVKQIQSAISLAKKGLDACRHGGEQMPGQLEERLSTLRTNRDQALAKVSRLASAPLAFTMGPAFSKEETRTYAEWFAACEAGLVEKHDKLTKKQSGAKKAFDQGVERQANQRQEQQARADARTKKLREGLKGDRLRIFDKLGEPSDYAGDIAKAAVWTYEHNTLQGATTTGTCKTTYKFSGDKLVDTQKRGNGC